MMSEIKMRIRQLGIIPPPYGGASVFVKRLTEQLNADGYISGAYYLKGNTDKSISKSPLYTEFRWLNTTKLISRFFSLVKESRPYGIIHSHFSLEGMAFLWGLSVFCNKKIVVTVHNSMVDNYFISTNSINRFFLKRIIHRNISWIAVSEEVKQKMNKLPVSFKNISVIPAYIPYNHHIQNIEEFLSASLVKFINKYKVIITFYGHSFMRNKGVDIYGFKEALEMFTQLLLENSNYINSIGLVYCISECNDEIAYNELLSITKSNNIQDNIYWQIGPIQEMSALWQVTDIYIRPTSTDGDSVAIREALDFGVHVVASNSAVRPVGTYVYILHDKSDFTSKVRQLINQRKHKTTNMDDMINYNKVLSIYNEIHTRD